MESKAREIKESIENVMTLVMKESMGKNWIKDSNTEDILMTKQLLGLMDSLNDYLIEEAKAMDEINSKLDFLVKLKGTES